MSVDLHFRVDELIRSVRAQLARERARAYRRALRHAGYLPESVELAVARDREWIDTGKADREED